MARDGYSIIDWGSGDSTSTDSTSDGSTSTDSTSDGGSSDGGGLPDIPTSLSDLVGPSVAATLKEFGSNPKSYIRGVIYGDLLAGFARLLKPIFTAITLLFLGSNAGVFAAANETFGLADVPVFLSEELGAALSIPVASYFDALESLVSASVPTTSGPIEGLVVVIVSAIVMIVLIETVRRIFWAAIDVIPGLSGLIGGG